MSGPAEAKPGLRQFYVAVGTQEAKLGTLVELLHALQADSHIAVAITCSARDSLDEVVATLAATGGFSLAVLHADLSLLELEHQVQQLKQRLHALQQRQEEQQQLSLQRRQGQHAGGEHGPRQQQQQLGQALAEAPQHAPGQHHHHHQQQYRAQGGVQAEAQQHLQGLEGAPQQPPDELQGQTQQGAQPLPAASLVLVTTDAPLRALGKEQLPLGLPLLVQYDIPPSKDVFLRRVSSVFGASKDRRRGAVRSTSGNASSSSGGAGAGACGSAAGPGGGAGAGAVGGGPAVLVDFVVAGQLAAFRARERFSSAGIAEMPVHVPDIFV